MKTMAASGQQLFCVAAMTSLLMDVAAVDRDYTRHLHRHQQQQQQDHQHGRMMTYGDDRCDDVCQLRQSVERLSAVQLDYGRALHAVYGLVDTVRRDVSAAR